MSSNAKADPPRWQNYRNPEDSSDPEPWGPAETLPPTATGGSLANRSLPRHRGRVIALLVGGAAVLGFAWTGAGWMRADVTTPVPQTVQALDVNVDTAPVAVRYGDVAQVQIIEHKRPRGARMEHRVVDGRLEVSYDPGIRFGPGIRQLEVVLPESMRVGMPDVTVNTSTGSVDVDGDYGAVDITTATGETDVDGNSQSLRAKASTGGVEVDGAREELVVQTSTGSIELDLRDVRSMRIQSATGSQDIFVAGKQPEMIESRTSTGTIQIELPDGAYQVQARSDTGHTEVTVPNDSTATHRISAESSTGSIRIS